LDYWLHLWCETYSWLERSKPKAALFVCYEDLCTRAETWTRLAELADVSQSVEGAEPLKLSDRTVNVDCDRSLVDRAAAINERLIALARSQLN
jgi:hypothetical protein